jgi:hypothetical protein
MGSLGFSDLCELHGQKEVKMATFKKKDTGASGYFETLENLSRQQMEQGGSLRTDSRGVEALKTGQEDATKRAQEAGTEIGKQTFKAPEVVIPEVKAPDISGATTRINTLDRAAGRTGTAAGEGDWQTEIDKAVDPTRKAITQGASGTRTDVNKTFDEATEALDLVYKNTSDFINKATASTAFAGATGQESQIQRDDRQIAEAMSDPSMRTSDVAQLAATLYQSFDPRLAVLQGEIMRPEVNELRGQALQALSGFEEAKGGTDRAVVEAGETAQKTREQIAKDYQTAGTDLTTKRGTTLDEVTAKERESLDALDALTQGKAGEFAAKRAGANTAQVEKDSERHVKMNYQKVLKDSKYPLKVNNFEELVDRENQLFQNPSYAGTQIAPLLKWMLAEPKVTGAMRKWAEDKMALVEQRQPTAAKTVAQTTSATSKFVDKLTNPMSWF